MGRTEPHFGQMTLPSLSSLSLSGVRNVTAEDYKKMYFRGKNECQAILKRLCYAHATIR